MHAMKLYHGCRTQFVNLVWWDIKQHELSTRVRIAERMTANLFVLLRLPALSDSRGMMV